jgi:NADPH:quinone reductase-like Zn-dependent oxidoreductase
MIIRLGQRHNIPIIHIVRRPEQIEIVRERGGEIILNSTDADFLEQLQTVTQKLKATLLLDAIGGNMTQQLAEAAPYGSTILLYSRLSQKDSVINPQTMLVKQLKIQGWFLGNWLQGKNPIQSLLLSRTAQSMISADLQSPIRQRLPLSAAQEGLEMYINNMSAGKILFVANPEE